MTTRPTDDQILSALFALSGEAGDLSLCPYYAGYGDRVCFRLWECADPSSPET